jgi:hypothetical protein
MNRTHQVLALAALVLLSVGCIEEEDPGYPAYEAEKNYCGPEGLFGVPNVDIMSAADFNPSCYNHDKCYAECKTNGKSQAVCDQEFRDTMDDACDERFNEKMNECDKESGISSYLCEAGARIAASSCWTQAATYHNGVAAGGKAVGSYPCED